MDNKFEIQETMAQLQNLGILKEELPSLNHRQQSMMHAEGHTGQLLENKKLQSMCPCTQVYGISLTHGSGTFAEEGAERL